MITEIASQSSSIDLTAVIVASIGALSAMFGGYMATQATKVAKINSHLLKTNSGKTIGQHVEDLKLGQTILRNELANIAEEKVKADALIASSSLEAIAKLAAAASSHLKETAVYAAKSVLDVAGMTATDLLEEHEKEVGKLIVEHEKEAEQNGQNRRFYDPS